MTNYINVAEAARKWGVSARSVRNYCANGRVNGAVLKGKTWMIPEFADKPVRAKQQTATQRGLLTALLEEKKAKISGGIYHRVQIDLTYNSNHMEGSRLTRDQTRLIFETSTIGLDAPGTLPVDDIVETANHFRCIDLVLDNVNRRLSEPFIKHLHLTLKNGTSDSRLPWFAVGDYKRAPNEVGGIQAAPPKTVPKRMARLLDDYNAAQEKTLDEILTFHVELERIHPFQDGNGRVGRLIMFKECLRNGIVPFIITDEMKWFYYNGLKKWGEQQGYLRDTCLLAQDDFKALLQYFRISFRKEMTGESGLVEKRL